MLTLDDLYNLPNLILIDNSQFNALLFAYARKKLDSFINEPTQQKYSPAMCLIAGERYLFVLPKYPDPRFFAPKVDRDLWEAFKLIDPVGSKSTL